MNFEENMHLIETEDGVMLTIKVTPKASENRIVGWEGEMLKIKVTAPPEKGEANQAVVRLLAHTFHLPQRDIVLIRGATSRIKQFCLLGITADQAACFLSI